MSTIVERLTEIVDAENTGGLYREDQAESFVRELRDYLDSREDTVYENSNEVAELVDLVRFLLTTQGWFDGADETFYDEGLISLAIKYRVDFNEVAEILDEVINNANNESDVNRGLRDLTSSYFMLNDLEDYLVAQDISREFIGELKYFVSSDDEYVNGYIISCMLSYVRLCMHSVNADFRINSYDMGQFKYVLNDELSDVVIFQKKLDELIDVSGIRRGSLGTLTWPLRAEIRSLWDTARDLENRKWR